jgi:hypothetical protein
LQIIKKKKVQLILMMKIFFPSGNVVQKAEWRIEIQCKGGIPKCYEAYNILSTSLPRQQSTSVSILF